jgi:hypothetical protein
MSKRNSVLSALLASAVSFTAILATADGASAATKPMLCIFLPLCQTAPVPPPPPKMIKHHHRHHHMMKKHK